MTSASDLDVAVSCLGWACTFGNVGSSEEDDVEILLFLFALFPVIVLLGPW